MDKRAGLDMMVDRVMKCGNYLHRVQSIPSSGALKIAMCNSESAPSPRE